MIRRWVHQLATRRKQARDKTLSELAVDVQREPSLVVGPDKVGPLAHSKRREDGVRDGDQGAVVEEVAPFEGRGQRERRG
eukprot:3425574-Rhodomonas_salina.3